MPLVRLRAKNQITLPAKVLGTIGASEGDILHIAADGDRLVITAKELRDRGPAYTMTDLLGAASGLYQSVDDIDREIDDGRAE
ncbi:MAG: AbrB/MazE/SpoVT family DNA-binding domain-containing protein [Holophagales bacterium]|nr:AbrB/MazE/SpoVT family DNA-binding domain-containing protein [Holophagales bacterium]MXX60483.1 AbrB/MazE/SpoVT family DNA-binding domain-containing protein [Holophagales bacterium]MYC08627.1 AbrB/MazE/SpoVT family DNA-binding domain-containing protein [Holophagales bacterium]MYD23518.1 AbrB/MazE/SpoVT family DNA-binding domain-containing protein [Holophagales bacterium]MYI31414.1 AbrB/MazE/SpoVT family DNA-binding domain-containing protein [Holophagales bacterium]